MEKSSQEYTLGNIFDKSIDREDLLQKKYMSYYPIMKDKSLITMFKEFQEESEEHIKMLKDLIIRMNIVD